MSPYLRHMVAALAAFAVLTGCSSVSSTSKSRPKKSLEQTLSSKKIVRLPYKSFGQGVYAVSLPTFTGEDMVFLVDTGATQSAVYKSTVRKIGAENLSDETVTIHGMIDNEDKPIVYFPGLKIGKKTYKNHKMAVLSDMTRSEETRIKPAGLLGMDILSDYRIYVDAEEKVFNLIPRKIPAPQLPGSWRYIALKSNPFQIDEHDLHYMEIRLGHQLLPALLDTGSEASIMNWSVSRFPGLKRARKKIYDDWVLSGAIGEFDPVSRVRVKNFRAGQKFWKAQDFIVMDFDNLDVLGINDQPFIIAGVNLLAERTFYLDFETNQLLIKPDEYDLAGRMSKGVEVYVGSEAYEDRWKFKHE